MLTFPRLEPDEDKDGIEEFLPGLPRQCKHCNTWDRYERPKNCKKGQCFSVVCSFCGKEFDVVPNMKGARK